MLVFMHPSIASPAPPARQDLAGKAALIFEAYDEDGDGVVGRRDLRSALRRILGPAAHQSHVRPRPRPTMGSWRGR